MLSRLSPTTRQTLLIAALTLVAYGLLLPFTGFYWDDWPFAWIARFLGPAEFVPAFMPFRPFLAPIFYFTTSLVPLHPLAWQIFALVVRFLIGVVAWQAFAQIFPQRKTLAYFAALLMLVFPGYSQHWVALTHINQELIPFLFYLLSFGFTFKALRTKKTAHTIIALLLQLCGVFPTEYFFGVEGIRFLLLFIFFQGAFFERFCKAFKVWLPYLLVWVFNAAWLFYYYKFGAYNSYEVAATQTPNLPFFLIQALDALWKAGLYVWIQIFPLTFSALRAPASLLTLALILLSFIFLARFLFRFAPAQNADKSFAVSLIFVGVFGILLGRLPSLAANLPLTLQSSYDRFMISMMIGAVLFALGVLELIPNQRLRLLILSALIAVGAGQQFFNANIFRRDWQKQADIYWQMTWRMPALKPDTVLLTHEMPIDYETDLSFTAPINWIYAPNYERSNLPYIFLYTEKRLGGPTLPSLEESANVFYPYRTVNFESDLSNALTIYMSRNSCLRVMNPARGDADVYDNVSADFASAVALSRPSRILPTDEPAAPIFFPEPKKAWCYYFAKIELYNQWDEYATSARYADEALAADFRPQDQREWTALVEAYALNDETDKALSISNIALGADAKTLKALCKTWAQIKARRPLSGAEETFLFNCSP
ncbi:MAG: hypothetical protein LC099_12165 [Anaerolineales bacterium]|nr:hypothetical protein [Anaerolineales bacterium]